MREIDLTQSLPAGSPAFGFNLGESFEAILKIIDLSIQINESGDQPFLQHNNAWKFNRYSYGLDGDFYDVLSYKNDALQLVFHSEILTEIILGRGYKGDFLGIRIGNQLPEKIERYDVFFNDQQDEFLLRNENGFLEGISFGTNCRSSLENVPFQIIEKIRLFL
jgi:hypothetical protein